MLVIGSSCIWAPDILFTVLYMCSPLTMSKWHWKWRTSRNLCTTLGLVRIPLHLLNIKFYFPLKLPISYSIQINSLLCSGFILNLSKFDRFQHRGEEYFKIGHDHNLGWHAIILTLQIHRILWQHYILYIKAKRWLK